MDGSILPPPGMPQEVGECAEFNAIERREFADQGYVQACECGGWTLQTWPRGRPEEAKKFTFRCKSWRHSGECRLWKGAQDFVRIKEGIESRTHWTILTLTHYQHQGISAKQMYREGVVKWSALRKRIIRCFGPIKYIQTWERHASGFPHVNVAISNEDIHVQSYGTPVDNWVSMLQQPAIDVGFGEIGWLDPLRSVDAVAGYLGKCARELTGVKKEYQIPENAPKGFRRIRASQKLLPPPYKNPDIAGVLHFTSLGDVLY